MTSTLYFLEQADVDLRSYMSNATGTMGKTRDGLALTGIDGQISLAVGSGGNLEKARQACGVAEKSCPGSKALKCPVNFTSTSTLTGREMCKT
jgi:organic hydroperoxide reductase OsmC/OhrA